MIVTLGFQHNQQLAAYARDRGISQEQAAQQFIAQGLADYASRQRPSQQALGNPVQPDGSYERGQRRWRHE